MKITVPLLLIVSLYVLTGCTKTGHSPTASEPLPDSSRVETVVEAVETPPPPVEIGKELLYDQHTLADSYPYKDTTRQFQWEKIRERLTALEAIQRKPARWAILRNYKNLNGEAPLVKVFNRDAYKRVADTLGVERYQSVPLYLPDDTITPEIYGRDGSLVRVKTLTDDSRFARVETVYDEEKEWLIPKKYLREIGDTVTFDKAIFVDRSNQNIATLEHAGPKWLVRSMNPATTGQHRPPYAQETPEGMYVLQEKKKKMVFLKDGSQETGGFAPNASRFTNGAYIHGVPVNAPRTALIEYSPSLGTIPRSHMCVRNATSHAQFVYDWGTINETIVFVFD